MLATVKLSRRRQRVAAVRGGGSDGGGGQCLAGGLQTKTPVYSSPEADPSEDRSRRLRPAHHRPTHGSGSERAPESGCGGGRTPRPVLYVMMAVG